MNTKNMKRILSILLCCVMLVGLVPTSVFAQGEIGTESNPAYCINFYQLKTALEDSNITYVSVGNLTETLEFEASDGADPIPAINVSGTKVLILNGTTRIKHASGAAKLYGSLIQVNTGRTLYIKGNGTLLFDASSTLYPNSVVEVNGGSLVVESGFTGTLSGGYIDSNNHIPGYAVLLKSGSANIKNGNFVGNFGGTNEGRDCAAVCVAGGSARISGGNFKSSTCGTTYSTDYGVMVAQNAILRLEGGTFNGIDLPDGVNARLGDYVENDCVVTKDTMIINPTNFHTIPGTSTVEIYKEIENVNVAITAPVEGETAVVNPTDIGSVPTGCTVDSIIWYENNAIVNDPSTLQFEAGKAYSVSIVLSTDSGHRFSDPLTSATINGKSAHLTANGNNVKKSIVLSYDFGTCQELYIKTVALNVAVPTAGANPAAPSISTDSTSIYVYEWYKGDTRIYDYDTFEGGQTYKLKVRVSTTKKFPNNVAVKVNGEAATVLAIDNNNTSVLFEKSFTIPVSGYTLTFDANGGSGSMAPLTGQTSYKLPACTFTAPSGKQFAGWNVFGYTQKAGDTVNLSSNMAAQAVWENIPQQDQPITAIAISCSGYVVGGNIAEAVPTTSSTGVTIASYEWQDNNGTKLTSGTFAADTQYRLRVFLNVADGYTANSLEKANVKINGTETTYFTNPCTGVDAQYGDMMIYHYPARLTAPQPTEYMVSYNANGGSGTMVGDMVEENGKFTLENCTYIAPEGYKFKAWAIGSVNGEQKQPGEQITITAETYIYAIWEAVEYNVTVTGGAASVGAGTPITKATMGTTVTLTANAAPSGKTFSKWVVNGVVVADANSATTTFVMPAGNVTAEATYKNIPVVTYTVTFNANGGTGSMADATGVSGDYVLPVCGFTAPNGKQFKAWSVGGVEKAAGDTITVNANTTVTAVWEDIPVTYYTVTFDSNGGSAVAAQNIEAGQKATKPADPTKDGYDFKGWTLNGSAYDFNTAVNGNITLVATWEQQQVQPTIYTVTFDSNGGSAVAAQNIEAGQKATKPADPTKDGYDFKGWTLNGSAYDFNTTVNGNITLVATWEKKLTSGGGGFIPTVQKPEIVIIGSGKAPLSTDGTVATITADEGYELVSVVLNGKDMGTVDKLTGLKTGDKAVITFQKKADDSSAMVSQIAEKIGKLQLIARSSKTAKKNVKVVLETDAQTKAAIDAIEEAGYTVKYKFYRSTKKSAGYKAMLTKSAKTYWNTYGKKGTMYYYKARVMVYDKEGKLVAQTELKQCKYACRRWSK